MANLLCIFALAFLFASTLLVSSAFAARRTALVIGNEAYESAPLRSPSNDARDMARFLRGLGFHVIERVNADQKAMVEVVEAFYQALQGAEVGLLFLAGQGTQLLFGFPRAGFYLSLTSRHQRRFCVIRRYRHGSRSICGPAYYRKLNPCSTNRSKEGFFSSNK